jgi:hypothetical protein
MTRVRRAAVAAAPRASGRGGPAGHNGRQASRSTPNRSRAARVRFWVLRIAGSTAALMALGALDHALTVAKPH